MGSDHIREASRHPRAYCVTGEGEGGVGQPGGGMGEQQRMQELAGQRGEGGREQTGRSRSKTRSHACVASKERAPWRRLASS